MPELNGARIARVLHVAVRDDLYAANLKDLTNEELMHCWHRETRKSGLKQMVREMRRREKGVEKVG